jgi:hypothetical protein
MRLCNFLLGGMLIFLLFLTSCILDERDRVIGIFIDLEEENNVKIDNLEMVSEFIDVQLAGIDKVIFVEDKLIILDSKLEQILILKNGEVIKKIVSSGVGPREFNSVENIHFDYFSNRLIIYDRSLMKHLYFDDSGDFLSENKIPVYYHDAYWLSGNYVVLHTGDFNEIGGELVSDNFVVVDQQFTKVYDSKSPYVEGRDDMTFGKSYFTISDGKLLVVNPFEEVIYSFDQGNMRISPNYSVNFGTRKKKFNEMIKSYEADQERILSEIYSSGMSGLVFNMVSTENLLLFNFIFNGESYYYVWDKISFKGIVVSRFFNEDNKILDVIGSSNQYFYFVENRGEDVVLLKAHESNLLSLSK